MFTDHYFCVTSLKRLQSSLVIKMNIVKRLDIYYVHIINIYHAYLIINLDKKLTSKDLAMS